MRTNLRLETHVEHAVGFVKNEVSHSLKVDEASRVGGQKLNHATGSADDDFRTALHVGDVVLEGHTAVSARSLKK
jgi:hypothetical protein